MVTCPRVSPPLSTALFSKICSNIITHYVAGSEEMIPPPFLNFRSRVPIQPADPQTLPAKLTHQVEGSNDQHAKHDTSQMVLPRIIQTAMVIPASKAKVREGGAVSMYSGDRSYGGVPTERGNEAAVANRGAVIIKVVRDCAERKGGYATARSDSARRGLEAVRSIEIAHMQTRGAQSQPRRTRRSILMHSDRSQDNDCGPYPRGPSVQVKSS